MSYYSKALSADVGSIQIFCRTDGKYDFYPMSYDDLSSVSQNVLKFYQQLTGEERRVPFIFGRNNQ